MSRSKKKILLLLCLIVLINIVAAFYVFSRPVQTKAQITGYKLTPILMVPADLNAKSEYQNSIDQTMADIQSWYNRQLGMTFQYDPVRVVKSSHPNSYFRCTSGSCSISGGIGTDYNRVLTDLDSLVGPRNGQLDRIIFLVGAGPLNIGGGALDNYRYSISGDSTLDAISGLLGVAEINRGRGGVAHELGHSFDLPHPSANIPEWDNLMGVGWTSYPNTVINDTLAAPELIYLKKSPFLIKQDVSGCRVFTGSRMSVTTNTVLCPGVYRVNGSSTGVLSIDANNVTLDASHASFIGGDTTSGKYGLIVTGRSNITIKNIRLSGYFAGVKVENSSNVTITESVINYNRQTDGTFLGINIGFPGEGGGIIFRNVTNSFVDKNMLNNQNSGIHLFDSNFNQIKNNTASYNKTWGVALYHSSDNQIIQNDTQFVTRTCLSDPSGCDASGVLVVQGSDRNLFEGNNMNYSGDGFFLGNGSSPLPTSNNNTIRNNVANYSPHNGIEATFSSGNIFDSNELIGNNYAFWLGYSHDGQVTNNIIKNSSSSGIAIDRGRNWLISGNSFSGGVNGLNVFKDPNPPVPGWPENEFSPGYDINNNTFINNAIGLKLHSAQDPSVRNNSFSANGNNLQYDQPVTNPTTQNNNFVCTVGGSTNNNLLLNKPVGASVGNSSASKANDGDLTGGLGIPYSSTYTWYVGNVNPGIWWKADLGSSQTINSFIAHAYINNYFDMVHQFHFEVSDTGNFTGEQTTVAAESGWNTGSSPNPRYKIYVFPPTTARYIRFVTDNSGQSFAQVQEIEAYNDPNIVNSYTPSGFCNYNLFNNLNSGTTTNAQNNYWEFAPKVDLAATIYDSVDNPTKGTVDYANPLSSKAITNGDSINPTININSPASGQVVNGLFNIGLNVADNVRVSRVFYYLNDIYLGNNFVAPYSFGLDTTRFANGSYTIKTTAVDTSGNSRTVTKPFTISNGGSVDTEAPQVTIGTPTNGATLSGVVQIAGSSTDNVGVTSMRIFIDDLVVQTVNYPSPTALADIGFQWDTRLYLNGPHSIAITAYDAAGGVGAVNISVTVNNAVKKLGDYNLDGSVNTSDLTLLINNWASTVNLQADGNNNNKIDIGDLTILINNWGN